MLFRSPVWTSQLFVNDWWKQSGTPLNVTVTPRGDYLDLKIENLSGKKIPSARLIFGGRFYEVGDITKGISKMLVRISGQPLQPFVQGQVNQFNTAVQQRQQQFGAQEGGHLNDAFASTTAASFLATATTSTDPNQPWNQNNYSSRYVTPPGFDLTPLMQRGDAILLAWLPGETLVPTLNQFTPRYSRTGGQAQSFAFCSCT